VNKHHLRKHATTTNNENKIHDQDAASAKIIRLHTASLQPLKRTVFALLLNLLLLSAGLVGDICLLARDNLSKHDHTVTIHEGNT